MISEKLFAQIQKAEHRKPKAASKLDLKIKKLAREAYYNAVRLFEDACLTYHNNSLPTAYFLALSSIEELGKVEMIDHYYADMRVNNECLCIPKDTFINSLFGKQNFYDHKRKHEAAGELAMSTKCFADIESRYKYFKEIHEERMSAIYVDYDNGAIVTPTQHVEKPRVLKALEIALALFQNAEDTGLEGTYWKAETDTQAEYKKVVVRLKGLLYCV